jgi:transcriptional regulator with XRE-family HTH domain
MLPVPSYPRLSSQTARPTVTAVFAHNLLVARLARDWTQQRLADTAGVSRATVAQLESGTGDPKLSTVEQLATALGVSPVLLLLGPVELEAFADKRGDEAPTLADHPSVQTMKHLVGTGFLRSRLEAANIGVHLADKEGVNGNHGAVIGAAIGSFHLPGRGTLTAAEIGLRLVKPDDEHDTAPRLDRRGGAA